MFSHLTQVRCAPMENQDSDQSGSVERAIIDRRNVLRGVGAMGVIGVVGTGATAARGQRGRNGHGNPQKECPCPDGVTGKYDFDSEACEFYHAEGADLVAIDGFTSKEGADCEPVAVEYEAADGYVVTKVCSFGGTDTHTDDDPNGSYESDLTNPGGQQAAISNITFCVKEAEEKKSCPEGLQLKYDGEWDPAETHGVEFKGGDGYEQTYYSPFPVDVYVFGGNVQEQQHESVVGEFTVTAVDRPDHPGGAAEISHVWIVCPGAEEPRVGN